MTWPRNKMLASLLSSAVRGIQRFVLELSRFLKSFARKKRPEKSVITLSILHIEGGNYGPVLKSYRDELRNSDVIVGKNIPVEFLRENKFLLRAKDVLLITKDGPVVQGTLVDFVQDFDVHKLRNLEKRRVPLVVTTSRKLAWMISQMFPFYCVCPGEPFEETVVTAPIPLTRNSDGYYFIKTPYKPSVTVVDLNIDIVEEFANR